MLGMRNFKIGAVFLMDKVFNLYSHHYPLHETKVRVSLIQNQKTIKDKK